MDEDDTYNRLKGLTLEEVEAIVDSTFEEISDEMASEGKDITNGIHVVELARRTDPKLKPYGWTYDRYFRTRFTGPIS